MTEHEPVGPVEPVEHPEEPTTTPLQEQETPEATEENDTDDEKTETEKADENYRNNRRLAGPGDEDYDPKLDRLIPNSVLVEQVEIEMRNSDGKASPTWEALYAEWEKENPEDVEEEEDDGEDTERES